VENNILLPYLALATRGLTLDGGPRRYLYLRFRDIFGVEGENSLKRLEFALATQFETSKFDAIHLIDMNTVLKHFNFRLYVRKISVTGYRIAARIEGVMPASGDVLLLSSRIGVSPVKLGAGISTVGDNDVGIKLDYLNEYANRIVKGVHYHGAPYSYKKTAEEIWAKLGMKLTAEQANRITINLYSRQFRIVDGYRSASRQDIRF